MTPQQRARLSLLGLAIGDGFGERFFKPPGLFVQLVQTRALPAAPWNITDDTAMARVLTEHLELYQHVQPTQLAHTFLLAYAREPHRGYGGGMHDYFQQMAVGQPHEQVAGALFNGTGSFGNGSAMRVAPLGGFFAGETTERVAEQATQQARVTHTHPEATAGAVATAVAAAVAWNTRALSVEDAARQMFDEVCAQTPSDSIVYRGLEEARALPSGTSVSDAARALGNGSSISAQDTVPFVVWSAAHHLDDFTEAMWGTVSAGGDRDTTCAMVGGIVALRVGLEGLPKGWIEATEWSENIWPF